MMVSILIVQIIMLIFTIATYGAISRMVNVLLKGFIITFHNNGQNRLQPWPDRENL